MELKIEQRPDPVEPFVTASAAWRYRVAVSEDQAVVAFRVGGTFHIGFEHEPFVWNVSLPASFRADEIYLHIHRNQGDPEIAAGTVCVAIEMLQREVAAYEEAALRSTWTPKPGERVSGTETLCFPQREVVGWFIGSGVDGLSWLRIHEDARVTDQRYLVATATLRPVGGRAGGAVEDRSDLRERIITEFKRATLDWSDPMDYTRRCILADAALKAIREEG